MAVFLKLFHGRNAPTDELDDWGFEGPMLGPMDYVHTTYASDVKYCLNGEDYRLHIIEGCVEYEGKYYGDWSVTSEAPK